MSTASIEQASISLPSHAAAAFMTLGVIHIMNSAKRVAQAPSMTSGGRMRLHCPQGVPCVDWKRSDNVVIHLKDLHMLLQDLHAAATSISRHSRGLTAVQGSTSHTSESNSSSQRSIHSCLYTKRDATSWPGYSGWGAHLLGALSPKELLLIVHCSLVLLFYGVHRLLHPPHLASDSLASPGLV